MVWPALGGITPRPCTMRMVAAGFASDEATVLFPFCSATLTPRAGIRRKADPEPSAGLRSGVTLTTVVPVGVDAGALAELALAGLSVAWTGLEVTCRVAEMPLPAVPPPVPKRSWVSLTVVTWDLANVAIMSGVIRRTVWPLASVVMEEGGRRNTSLPWMRKLVAVSGMLLPVWGFTPSCPVIATCLMMFCPLTFWMTAAVDALGAELPGELVAGLLTGLVVAGRLVTVRPVCPAPGRCTVAVAV